MRNVLTATGAILLSTIVAARAADLAACFSPPPEFANQLGDYRPPLLFADGRPVTSAQQWPARRGEILSRWHELMGPWPPVLEKPKLVIDGTEHFERHARHRITVEVAPGGRTVGGFLLVPDGGGPFPAVVIPYYDAKTAAGLGGERLDFGRQLANRGFAALCIGSPDCANWPSAEAAQLQPLSMLAYVAANCHTALSQLENVDPKRIGIVGHSYGGKWAMFASCLYDKFACAAWSDPGIVFDEKRANVNYWEPWYLGYERGTKRKEGVPADENPRTGAYKTMIAEGRDLHELHALMAPRPFLVSGGAEDGPRRWEALNHTIAVNSLLGFSGRVAMTNRPDHTPTLESNEQLFAFFEKFLGANRN